MAVNKIPVSFKKSEEDIYNFVKGKRNASCYIKDLVENDMNNNKERVVEVETINNNDFGLDF